MALTRKQQDEFIAQIGPLAQAAAAKYGICASVCIAQAILESAWGASRLTREGHNYFGIKAARSGDPAVEMPTEEVIRGKRVKMTARFRKFTSRLACFDFYGRWISTSKHYVLAMGAADAPEVFVARLWQGGYSTSPTYPVDVMRIVTQFDLKRFDLPRKKKEG